MPASATDNSSNELPRSSRYVVGIDLGTTNSAVCYVDTDDSQRRATTFRVPQLVAPGQIEPRDTLPSFLYQAAAGEFPRHSLQLPWQEYESRSIVGVMAREQGKLVPGRSIESAKSWLCHTGVDRTAPLLPWQGAEDVDRLSPVAVSSAYLAQIRLAWNHAHPDQPLEDQDVVVTLPASFDEVARELTIQAAQQAGLPRLYLIEEPQAAFYAWIDAHRDSWEQQVTPGQTILVCDVGGGTSDFTLIRVRRLDDGTVQFQRIAVGEHLILGGDNIDLALAKQLEPKLAQQRALDSRQWGSLVKLCRHMKEVLLGDDADERRDTYTLSIPGGGSKLIGGGLQAEVTRKEVQDFVLEGFLPLVERSARPTPRRSGFQEFGLPYAADAGITRYLAAFLTEHQTLRQAGGEDVSIRPDVLLFNGGVFDSPLLRQRIVDQLSTWYRDDLGSDWQPQLLKNERHDLAVARGAAYYGLVRRGEGVRISAGLPRTYYLGIDTGDQTESERTVVCLVPAGMEPGEEVHLDSQTFELTVAAPVEFPLLHSSVRLTDQPGDILHADREQLTPLPPIRTVLRSRKAKETAHIPVQLHTRLTELGTLAMWCSEVGGNRTWQIQFDVRSATQTDRQGHSGSGESQGLLDEETLRLGQEQVANVFADGAEASPKDLPRQLQDVFGQPREEWAPALLRGLWDTLLECEPGRRRSAAHEARWLNLLGFSLRPGFGVALDDWRVNETWKLLQGKLSHPTTNCLAEWRILWRRVAGGLNAGQQQALAAPVLSGWRDQLRKLKVGRRPGAKGKKGAGLTQADAEVWRMLGSLELLNSATKTELGDMALTLLGHDEYSPIHSALIWAVGRIGARVPFYGPLNGVLPAARVGDWLTALMSTGDEARQFAVMQLARRTNDRYRDISDSTRDSVLRWLKRHDAAVHLIELVAEGGELAGDESAQIFGESLPSGLRLKS